MNNQELIRLIIDLLSGSKSIEKTELSPELLADKDFQRLYDLITDLRGLSHSLNTGDLHKFVSSQGYVIANLKSLQANLRHLTWQTKQIANGDFSQRVDFLGDFSYAFNEMTVALQKATNALIKSATLDPLTEIPNRAALNEFLQQSFNIAKDTSSNLHVLMLDIDHFKNINDTYGHSAGDEVLRHFSRVLTAQFRSTDCFGRYGGEEFLAILPNIQTELAIKIGERCLESIRTASFPVSHTAAVSLTTSAGLAFLKDSDEDYKTLIERSDLAMYDAKARGRDCLCVR